MAAALPAGDVFVALAFLAGAFVVTRFLAATFFGAAFVNTAFVATAPFVAEDFALPALLAAPVSVATVAKLAIKNFERSFAAASHAGAGLRPLALSVVEQFYSLGM
jgi:hypothetical protein